MAVPLTLHNAPLRAFPAVKILEKAHIIKEKKDKYVMKERDALNILSFSPYIIKLFYTFQDAEKLYFALECAESGELLDWIKRPVIHILYRGPLFQNGATNRDLRFVFFAAST